MLARTDRLALAVPDADAAAEAFQHIFATEIADDRKDEDAGARRLTLSFGRDLVELLQPLGPGPVAEFLEAQRTGVFAGGFSLADPAALAARLERAGVRVREQSADRFVVFPADLSGIGVILAKRIERERVGLCDKIWQITYAVPDLEAALQRYSELFALENAFTNRYDSERFGYTGAITWFEARDGGLLDSLEYLEPRDPAKAVARFVGRNQAGIYMVSIESDQIPEIRRRVVASGPGWDGAEFGGFIHPKRTHGLLVGLVTYEGWNARRPLPG